VGSNPISSTKSQMLKAHSSTMNCSKRPGDCEARASVSPTVHSLCARVKSQTRGGFNETKAMVYVPGYTLLVGLLVIMSAALARCVSRKVIGKLEYGDLHRLEVGFAKVSVMQIRNAKRVVLEAHAVSSPSATRK